MVNLVPKSFFEASRLPALWEDDSFWDFSSQNSGLAISEDDKSVYVEAHLPGVDPGKTEVTFDKGMLWIKGQQEQEESNKKYYRKAASSFSYHVHVPENVDTSKEPQATCKNGVMKIIFAKQAEVTPKKISVKAEQAWFFRKKHYLTVVK